MNEYLEPKSLDDKPPFMVNPAGNGSIARFSSKNFGGTFSRVIRTEFSTVTIETNPETGNHCFRVGTPRIKDTIIYGRITNYPNTTESYWKTLAEEEPYFDYFQIGQRPYITIKYLKDYRVDLLNSSYALGDKVVIQLLFVEL